VDPERRCPRCGTALSAGKLVCQRCEQPVDSSASLRYNPAGLARPSPIQGHATVMVGIMTAIVVLAIFAFNALQGVGPFTAQVVGQMARPDRTGITVELRVTNDGSRSGKARCQVTGRSPDGELLTSPVLLTDPIQPKGSVRLQLPVEKVGQRSDLDVTCT
jgi:hypothetical protein